MIGEMLSSGKHPLKPLPAGARCRFPSPIPWGHLLVPSPFVQGPDSHFDLRIADHQEPPTLHVAADSNFRFRATAASSVIATVRI
jgi:hypothetical protein